MAKSNLTHHEQHLKALEKTMKEIGNIQDQISKLANISWKMVLAQFVTIDSLRTTRLEFEKESQ